MFQDTPAWRAHQRKRMRTNAHLAIRHDAYRFMPPDSPRYVGKDVVRYFWPDENVRRSQAAERKDSAEIVAELDIAAERDELLRLKRELAAIKFELRFRRLLHARKYSPDQPRAPAGNPDGGQWTSESGNAQSANDAQEEDTFDQSLTTAPDQRPRGDLSQLQAIANDPAIRSQIDQAWTASNPNSMFPQEHGFWIARNEATGELFTRPFASRGLADSITPGPTPNDAVASFHTHPNRPDLSFRAGPSGADVNFAAAVGLPGLLQSHNGMYYFGPPFRPWRQR